MEDDIEVTITGTVRHIVGPRIADPAHIVAWIVADGQHYGSGRGGVAFDVCPNCPDPDTCACTGEVARYGLMLDTVA